MTRRAPWQAHEVRRHERVGSEPRRVQLAVEAPLEIRLAGDTVSVTMRTPGHDRELAVGFLFAEGVIAGIDDVGSVAHCGRSGDPSRENVIDVLPAPGAALDPERAAASRRGTITTSACGACGRARVDDLLSAVCAVESPRRISVDELGPLLHALRESQPVFEASGGSHGAALFAASGAHVATYEDVGRHNAMDKLLGARLLHEGLTRVVGAATRTAPATAGASTAPLAGGIVVVSGRTSFDVVHKALVGRAGALVGIGAPSDLAVQMARRAGLPLYGFARSESVEEYA
jgi:FdhD protein